MSRGSTRLSLIELRRRIASGDQPLTPQLLARLRRDGRQGARSLYESLQRRYERERQERLRLDAMRNFERVLWRSGIKRVAGVDEVGMGPLAGPVVAAAVVFAPDVELAGIDDSKRLEPGVRVALAAQIHARAVVGIGVADVEEIDALNIYQAGLLAMRRAVEAMPEPPEHVLVDARTIPGIDLPQNEFQKGDGINYSIAAASIVAKVHRDQLMEQLDREYPGWGFARHKGYATPDHQAAIRRLGPSPVHRSSFTFIRELCGQYSPLFYSLQRQLARACDAERLARFEASLRDARSALSDEELRKLRLVAARRWKSL
jgi:ribonuclease HII